MTDGEYWMRNYRFRCYKTYLRVSKIIGPCKAALWLKTNNPLLGDVSPEYMILVNRYIKLTQFIKDARDSNIDYSLIKRKK